MPAPHSRHVLAVLSRLPVAGCAKTRLIPALGPEGAAELQREMTRHTLRQARCLSARTGACTVVWSEGGTARDMRAAFGPGPDYRSQPAGDLGVRIRGAIDDALSSGADRVVVIGCDCPDLDAARLYDAFVALDDAPVVLGPAADGGYYLIGVRGGVAPGALTAAFDRIPWSTSSVFDATVTALRGAGVIAGVLPVLSDVDEPSDLPVWQRVDRPPATLSVVIAALDEEAGIAEAVTSAAAPGVEVIVADGGSSDRTREIAEGLGARVIAAPKGRARQLNAGAVVASGDAILFLHADTVLPPGFAATALGILADPDVSVGAFAFTTDLRTPTMRLFDRGTNWRARSLGMPYGDQALFVRAATFRGLGGFPDIPVMEDYEFVSRARACGRVRIAREAAVTSGRAWREHGTWRWMLANRLSVLAYRAGMSPESIARRRGRARGSD